MEETGGLGVHCIVDYQYNMPLIPPSITLQQRTDLKHQHDPSHGHGHGDTDDDYLDELNAHIAIAEKKLAALSEQSMTTQAHDYAPSTLSSDSSSSVTTPAIVSSTKSNSGSKRSGNGSGTTPPDSPIAVTAATSTTPQSGATPSLVTDRTVSSSIEKDDSKSILPSPTVASTSTWPYPVWLMMNQKELMECLSVGGRWVTTNSELQLDPPESRMLYMKGCTLSFLFASTWLLSPTHHGRYLRMSTPTFISFVLRDYVMLTLLPSYCLHRRYHERRV
jgi:hypothetical protein